MDLVSRMPTAWVVISLIALTGVRAGLSLAERRRSEPNVRFRNAGEFVESFVIAVVIVFLVIRPFLIQAFYIPSRSMTPTLGVNDRVLVNKLCYRFREPARNEIIVFRAPKEAAASEFDGEEKDFIKRVVGLPGDTVEVHD